MSKRLAWAAAALLVLTMAALVVRSRSDATPDELRAQARSAATAGDWTRVEAALSRLEVPTPADLMLRAQAADGLGHTPRAIELLDAIPDSDPIAPQARFTAGHLELKRHRLRAAEPRLLQAVALAPGLRAARKDLVVIYGLQHRRADLDAQFRALAEAAPSFETAYHWCLPRGAFGDPADSVPELREVIAADPGDRRARLALAADLRRLGHREEAAEALAPLPPDDPGALALRARLALDRGDRDAARALLATGPEDHVVLARLRGLMALEAGDAEAAIRHYRRALALDPDDRDSLFGLGHALQQAGRAVEAGPYLDAAAARERLRALIGRAAMLGAEGDVALLRDLGSACEAIGRLDEARAWYRLVLARDPLDPEAQKALHRLREAAGEPPSMERGERDAEERGRGD